MKALCAVAVTASALLGLWPHAIWSAEPSQDQMPAQDRTGLAGIWRTVDDETGRERALVRMTESGGVITGRIDRISDPQRQDAVCEHCAGTLKGQKVVGLAIIENVTDANRDGVWDGGTILDPTTGKTYRVELRLEADGRQLRARGFLGPFYRTQIWRRLL